MGLKAQQSTASDGENKLVGHMRGENVSFIDRHDVGFVANVRNAQVRNQATTIIRYAAVLGPGHKHAIFRGDAKIETAIPVISGFTSCVDGNW